jgi:MFS family permease
VSRSFTLVRMRGALGQRSLRFVFIANLISMMGSGMNGAAVTWYILQATHSEMALGTLVALQTVPAMLLMPFSGVIIDRQDRRHLVMMLDIGRALVISTVAVMVFSGHVRVWHLYAMNVLVSLGFWMFWPSVTALVQELTPGSETVSSNSLLTAGVQGGWLMAGALVGFIYNHVGLGGILLIDVASYAVSFSCYFAVRKGRHVVQPAMAPAVVPDEELTEHGGWRKYLGELYDGVRYVKASRGLMLFGIAWSLFTAAMLTQGVVTAPLSDRILHAGAVGYGWLNGGWAIGAVVSVFYAARFIKAHGARPTMAASMATLAACLLLLPYSRVLPIAVALYAAMGSGRGTGGIAMNTELMESVPARLMGRVQNTFYFFGLMVQVVLSLLIGVVAHTQGLKYGFFLIGGLYTFAAIAAAKSTRVSQAEVV